MKTLTEELAGMTEAQKDQRIAELERALITLHAKVMTITQLRTSTGRSARSFTRSLIRRIRCEFGPVGYLKGENNRKGLRR